MNWPGENLLIKLWESLADKGVGALLKPWQIRREGRANVDLRRYELLALADAEREVEDIRSGRRQLENARFVLSLTENATVEIPKVVIDKVPLLELTNRSVVADALRKEVNVAKAVLHAEDELRDDQSPPPTQNLDDDWLYRWRDYAGSVSSDELQTLWGRILAGELKSPGLYSYRLLDFVRNLSKDEAELIEKLAPFAHTDIVVRDHDAILEDAGLTFGMLLQLQGIGILSGVEAFGMSSSFSSNSKDHYIKVFLCHGRGLLIEHDDVSKKVTLGCDMVTNLGMQVIKLGKFVPNENYLTAVGRRIQKLDFKVSLIDYLDLGNGLVRYSNAQEIPNADQDGTDQPATTHDPKLDDSETR